MSTLDSVRHREAQLASSWAVFLGSTPIATKFASSFLVEFDPLRVQHGSLVTRHIAYEQLTLMASILRELNPGLAQQFIEEFLGFASDSFLCPCGSFGRAQIKHLGSVSINDLVYFHTLFCM